MDLTRGRPPDSDTWWAARAQLQPGEWRESAPEVGWPGRGRERKRARLTRGERSYLLAANTGSLRTLWMEGGGRFREVMQRVQRVGGGRRLEEGADVSGVT